MVLIKDYATSQWKPYHSKILNSSTHLFLESVPKTSARFSGEMEFPKLFLLPGNKVPSYTIALTSQV